MLKKRREGADLDSVEAVVPEVAIKVCSCLVMNAKLTSVQDGDLESYVVALNSNIKEHIHDGAHRLRKLLSVGMNPTFLNASFYAH